MTDRPGEYVASRIDRLCKRTWDRLGVRRDIGPFMALCCVALPFIPMLKIAGTGLFDVNAYRNVPVKAE